MALPRTLRLTPERWADAALELGSREGIAAINMERVALELGVTKGSAYHHFNSRTALLESALERWAHVTQKIIEALTPMTSPHERLTALLATSIGRRDNGMEYHILTSSDPAATPFIERVTEARLAFVEQIYRDFGLDNAQAELWARSCYSTYLGTQVLQHTLPADTRLRALSSPDLTEIVQQLTPPSTRE
ncbi:MAG: TetR/AcrR family transcriptional regulator [Rhodoglobus sp.]